MNETEAATPQLSTGVHELQFVAPPPEHRYNAMPAYRPADRDGLYLTSYLRWLPRTTGGLRFRLLMAILRRFGRLNVHADTDLIAMRAKLERKDARTSRIPAWARRDEVNINGMAAEWITAQADPARVVLYLHGGAFAFRFPAMHGAFAARLSRMLRARVLLPDYRLAPEYQFPAPQDDCLNAYRFLLDQGIEPGNIVVGGDSAGGCLTLGLLLRLAREGLPQPGAAFVLSPATDVAFGGETLLTRAAMDPMLPTSAFPVLMAAYIDEQWRMDPTASPLLGNFADLAPVLIQVGTREVLLDDSRRMAQRIHEGGGRVMCEIWTDMPHVFPVLPYFKESAMALANIGRFINAAVGWDIATV